MFRGDEPLRDLGCKYSQRKLGITMMITQFISITKKLQNGLIIIYQEDATSIGSNSFFVSGTT